MSVQPFPKVGAEKEMNFLDLFKEVIYLLPSDIEVGLNVCIPMISLVGLFSSTSL